jgi:acyl-CoA reductase-like NAD-dependent aldehyde dehydrogenase
VVCVYGYDDIEQAFAQANALPFSFQAAIFTRDLDAALRGFKQLDASAVMVNDHTAFRVDGMPFAGLRESGLGVGGIPHTIDDMQIDKMMVISPASCNGQACDCGPEMHSRTLFRKTRCHEERRQR